MNEFPEFPDAVKLAFRQYREAHPDPEPSAAFMPGIWRKVEGRRRTFGSLAMLRHLAQTYVGLAIAAAIVLGVFVIPRAQENQHLQISYAEVVADDYSQQEVAKAFAVPVAYQTPVPEEDAQ